MYVCAHPGTHSILSCYHVGLRNETQVVKISGKYLYPLNHFVGMCHKILSQPSGDLMAPRWGASEPAKEEGWPLTDLPRQNQGMVGHMFGE